MLSYVKQIPHVDSFQNDFLPKISQYCGEGRENKNKNGNTKITENPSTK